MAGPPEIDSRGCAALDEMFRQAVHAGDVPGMVAAVTNQGRTVYLCAFGRRDIARDEPMTTDTIFRIASMTKPVTSLAAMMLCADGVIGLDDAVGEEIPRRHEVIEAPSGREANPPTRPAKQQVTVRHLLTHTSGVGYEFTHEHVSRTNRETGANPIAMPLLFEPGSDWLYSPGTTVLGRIIERKTRTSLEELFQARILRPLEMTDTSYDLPSIKLSRLATVYRRNAAGFEEAEPPQAFHRNCDGGTGLVSTAADYASFLRLSLNGGTTSHGDRVVSAELVQSMTSNQIGDLTVKQMPAVRPEKAATFPKHGGRDKFGFGFQISTSSDAGGRSEGSYSWGGSRNTHFWVDPVKGLAAIMLAQVVPYYDPSVIGVLERFANLIYRHLI